MSKNKKGGMTLEWTPKKYWRVARSLSDMLASQNKELSWPVCINSQSSPPETGDGVILADYDHESPIGLIRFLSIVANSGPLIMASRTRTELAGFAKGLKNRFS